MGSRKRLVTALAALAITAAACTNGDASGNQATEAMENAGVDRDTAVCIGNQLENQLTQDELNQVARASDVTDLRGEPVTGTEDDLTTVTRSVMDGCFGGTAEADTDTADEESGDDESGDSSDE
jgi:hypothetical protein